VTGWSFCTKASERLYVTDRAGFFVPLLLRKFSSSGDAGFERDLVTEALKALDVIADQALRFETVRKSPP